MPFKYRAAMLTGVALSAWSASGMTTAGSLRKNIMPSSYASGGMNATHVPGSSNQRTLSNANMTVRTISDEERGRLPAGNSGEALIGMIERLGEKHPDLFDSNLFTSPLFFNVYHIAKHGKPKTMNKGPLDKIIELFSKNGKKKLAEFAVAATKMGGAEKKELAEAMLGNMFTVWKNDDKFDPKSVFKILELHETNGNVLRHPLFSKWVSYVKLKYPNFKEAYEMMFATLEDFGKSDDLVDFYLAGETIISRVADSLLVIQLEKWRKQKKSAKDVFMLLRLEQTEGNLFESPLFFKWTSYLNKKLEFTKLRRRMMFTVLEEMCAERLVGVLLLGAKNERTKVYAYDLLDIQLEKWKMNKKDASEAFKLLELKQPEGSLFMNPIFYKWKNTFFGSWYISMNETYQMIYTALKHAYGDRLGSVLLEEAKNESVSSFANTLLDMNKALADFKQLKQTHGNLFVNKAIFDWLKSIQSTFPGMNDPAILERLFSHDELADIILRGMLDDKTKTYARNLMNSLSNKEAVLNCLNESLGL